VSWLRQLVPGLSLQRPRFDPMSVFVGFVVDEVDTQQVFINWLLQSGLGSHIWKRNQLKKCCVLMEEKLDKTGIWLEHWTQNSTQMILWWLWKQCWWQRNKRPECMVDITPCCFIYVVIWRTKSTAATCMWKKSLSKTYIVSHSEKSTIFWELDLFSSSDERVGRHLHSWVEQKELFLVTFVRASSVGCLCTLSSEDGKRSSSQNNSFFGMWGNGQSTRT
jgi:hypothetical protein